jgi:hypothetical protein
VNLNCIFKWKIIIPKGINIDTIWSGDLAMSHNNQYKNINMLPYFFLANTKKNAKYQLHIRNFWNTQRHMYNIIFKSRRKLVIGSPNSSYIFLINCMHIIKSQIFILLLLFSNNFHITTTNFQDVRPKCCLIIGKKVPRHA